MKSLDDLALLHGTDKSSRHHNYAVRYEQHFERLRGQAVRLLEIGVHENASLRMWADYFPLGEIIGVDVNPACVKGAVLRTVVLTGSQNDSAFLRSVSRDFGFFDIVIDDGSHRPDDVQISLYTLFPLLVPGGWYVLEDLMCSFLPSVYGSFAGVGNPENMVEWLKRLLDTMHGDSVHGGGEGDGVSLAVSEIHHYHGIVFLRKKVEG